MGWQQGRVNFGRLGHEGASISQLNARVTATSRPLHSAPPNRAGSPRSEGRNGLDGMTRQRVSNPVSFSSCRPPHPPTISHGSDDDLRRMAAHQHRSSSYTKRSTSELISAAQIRSPSQFLQRARATRQHQRCLPPRNRLRQRILHQGPEHRLSTVGEQRVRQRGAPSDVQPSPSGPGRRRARHGSDMNTTAVSLRNIAWRTSPSCFGIAVADH